MGLENQAATICYARSDLFWLFLLERVMNVYLLFFWWFIQLVKLTPANMTVEKHHFVLGIHLQMVWWSAFLHCNVSFGGVNIIVGLMVDATFGRIMITLPETNCTCQWMLGILVSFGDGLFSGAMLVLGSVSQFWVFIHLLQMSKVVSTHLWNTPLNLYQ